MTVVVLILVSTALIVVALLFGAVVELHRQVLQLRMHAGLIDDLQPVSYNTTVTLDELELGELKPFGTNARALLIVLSDGCSTCHEIARGLRTPLPDGLAVVLEARSPDDARVWLSQFHLGGGPSADGILVETGGRRARRLGVNVTPMMVRFERGLPIGAYTLPSRFQFEKALNWLHEDSEERVGGRERE